jgi:hypothetical protein
MGRRINGEGGAEEANLKKSQRNKILSLCRVRQQPFEKARENQKERHANSIQAIHSYEIIESILISNPAAQPFLARLKALQ